MTDDPTEEIPSVVRNAVSFWVKSVVQKAKTVATGWLKQHTGPEARIAPRSAIRREALEVARKAVCSGCGPVAKLPVLGTGDRRFKSGHPDPLPVSDRMFVDGHGDLVDLLADDLRYLVAIAKQLDGPLWDKRDLVATIERRLYTLGFIQFRLDPAKPNGVKCTPYPTAIAAIQLIARGLV